MEFPNLSPSEPPVEIRVQCPDPTSGVADEVRSSVGMIERATHRTLGDPANPLFLAVRCSPDAAEIPFLGMTERVVEALARSPELLTPAWDAYCQFIERYGELVLGIPRSSFEEQLVAMEKTRGTALDVEVTDEDWKETVYRYKQIYREQGFANLIDDPVKQMQIVFALAIGSGAPIDLQVLDLKPFAP